MTPPDSLNTLYFVKFSHIDATIDSPIVFLLTSANHSIVQADAWKLISHEHRAFYTLKEVTPVCQTPDTLPAFEPC